MSFLVIESNDSNWDSIVKSSIQYDFYHTRSYHLLEKENRCVLLVMKLGDDFIAFPLVIRSIPNSEWFDCTSVYGYCGPISNKDYNKLTFKDIAHFQEELISFFKSNNIITSFSRLNPLIPAESFFLNFGSLKEINKTVAIDLRLTSEEQKKQYRKSNRSELNQLRRKGYYVVEAKSEDEINSFIDIYYETMKRVGAKNNYYFQHSYFYDFLKSEGFIAKLLLVKKEEKIIAGAIFTITKKIMQYHLAGTTEAFIKDTPMKLIIDEARLLGNNFGLDFLHLGGGVGGSDDDSLFKFKAGFSDFRFMYKVWQLIVDEKKYENLILQKGSSLDRRSDYFPLYRAE